MKIIGNFCDDETHAILNGGVAHLSPYEQDEAKKYARQNKELFAAGRAMVPDYWQKALRDFDPLLAARYDFYKNSFVIDIWQVVEEHWKTVYDFGLDLGETKIAEILTLLAASNMQRYDRPEDLVRARRLEAEATREINRKAGTEKVLEAVDSLSSKSVKQFVDVHKAIHTGEKITAHGSDLAFLDMARENTKKVEAEGGKVVDDDYGNMTPGANPLIFQRPNR